MTIVFGLTLFGMSSVVSRLRVTKGISEPSIAGDPIFERGFRAHMNTVEWAPMFLPSMWLFAIHWSGLWAAMIGAAWIIGRIIYVIGYVSDPEKRFMGMSIQAGAACALSVGVLGRILYVVF